MNSEEIEFFKKYRWEMAKSYLDRSDQAANLLRGLLFTAAAAAMGLILQKATGGLKWHALSLSLFVAATCIIFYSWDLQKSKAIGRFNALAKNDLAEYERYKSRPNFILDRWAGVLILFGVVSEIILGF
jgi:hypothetical protein